jgi:TonB family protein
MENLGEGRPAFLGRSCPGRQQDGNPFRIDESPLPEGYDPSAYPESDVVACVRLDSDGAVLKAQIVDGTGSPALDRRLLRTLYRHWRFAPADGSEVVRGWQRIRLNSAPREAPLPEHRREWVLL